MAPYPHVLYYCSTISLRRRGGLAPAINVCELGSITSRCSGKFETGHAERPRKSSLSLPICEPGADALVLVGPPVNQDLSTMIDLLKKPLSIYLLGIGLKGNSKLTGNSLRPFGTQKKVLGEFRLWSRLPHYLGIETIKNLSATDDLALIQTEKSLF